MEAVLPDFSTATRSSVDGPRGENREPPHAVLESRGRVRLDDEVDVIGLDREVDDAKSGSRGPPDESFQGCEDGARAQRWHAADRTHRHMDRVAGNVFGARPVFGAGPRVSPLATGSSTSAAPARDARKLKLFIPSAPHLPLSANERRRL